MARTPLSGTQHVLRAGDAEARVASVGASLRSFSWRGRDLVVPFEADEMRPAFRGATLAPWPNRVVDGRFVFAGEEYELALTEPKRSHALHGLLGWADYTVVDKGASHVTLTATVEAQVGYPWRVVVETTYALRDGALTQSVRAYNDGESAAPWGTGPHPYLVAGPGRVDDWMLQLPAARVLEVTPDRLSPTDLAEVDIDADRFDFRTPRVIGATEIDHAFTGLERDAEGFATVTVTDDTGAGVAMTWDASCEWVQIHTADQPTGAVSPLHRVGLAVEPMTCAPDAFNADRYAFDTGLRTIFPGAWSDAASWSILPID